MTASTNLSDAEVEKAVKEAEQYAEEDKKRKEAIEVQNQADAMVFQTEKTLEEVGDKIDAADKSNIETELSKLKALVEKTKGQTPSDAEIAELKAGTESLTNAINTMATKMYQQTGGPDMSGFTGNGAGPNPNGGNGGNDGPDVVDADFKEV
jgi:molecular chaperone DnaK